MATKRMFSKLIVQTDAFMEMPPTSQLLYFHLVMEADDEGFVSNPKRIIKLTNAGEDDYKILIAKRFILVFDSGVIVIKHWLIHNTIRMDRFNKTSYQDEKNLLIVKENKSYTLMATNWQPNGNHGVTQVNLKLSKAKLENSCSPSVNDTTLEHPIEPKSRLMAQPKMSESEFDKFWEIYPRKTGKAEVKKNFLKLDKSLFSQIIQKVEVAKKSKQWQDTQYIPMPATWINQGRWDDEETVSEMTIEKEIKERVDREGPNAICGFISDHNKLAGNGDALANKFYNLFPV